MGEPSCRSGFWSSCFTGGIVGRFAVAAALLFCFFFSPLRADGAQDAKPIETAKAVADRAVEQVAQAAKSDPWTWVIFGGAALVIIGLVVARSIAPGVGTATRNVGSQPAFVWLLCAIVTLLASSAGASLASAAAPRFFENAPQEARSLLIMLSGSGLGLAIGLLLLRLIAASTPGAGLGFQASDIVKGVIALALAAPVVLAANLAANLLYRKLHDGAAPEAVAHPVLRSLRENPQNVYAWGAAAAAVVLAPILEEIVYRGFLQSALLRMFGKPWAAIVVASAVFAAMHIIPSGSAVPWYAVPAIFTLGLAMGTAFERTGRLGVAIVMHALFNAANVALTATGAVR